MMAGCAQCKDHVRWSAAAEGIFLWFPNRERPIMVKVNDQDCHVCLGCDAAVELLDMASAALPDKQILLWQVGRIVFRDGHSVIWRNPKAQTVATA